MIRLRRASKPASTSRRRGELSFVEAEFGNQNGVDGLGRALGVGASPDGTRVYAVGSVDNGVAVSRLTSGNGVAEPLAGASEPVISAG